MLAKYPAATIVRLETDSNGVYEAHITTGAGEELKVGVNGDFTVTGEEAHRGGGRDGPCPPASANTEGGGTGTSWTT